jgi:hypothetical protein
MSKEQLIAKYNLEEKIWKNEPIEKLKSFVKWFQGVQE